MSTILPTVKSNFTEHPFKEGISLLLLNHFHYDIVKHFTYRFEVEMYHKGNKGIANQIKDDNFICEVYYTNPKTNLSTYICDVASWWPKQQCEWVLLRCITDKLIDGTIGKDWKGNQIKVSKEIKQGLYATPEEVLKEGTVPIITKKGG